MNQGLGVRLSRIPLYERYEMSYDKDYPNRKDHRCNYYRRGKYSRGCRPHGSCDYCRRSRLHNNTKRIYSAKEKMKEDKP